MAYWVAAFEEGRKATERLLAKGHVPVSHRARIETKFAKLYDCTVSVKEIL